MFSSASMAGKLTDHFMTAFELQRDTAIFGVAGLGIVPTEHTCISTRDAEKTWKERKQGKRLDRD